MVGLGLIQLALFRKLQSQEASASFDLRGGGDQRLRFSEKEIEERSSASSSSSPLMPAEEAAVAPVTVERHRMLVATRVHQANAERLVDLTKLEVFIVQALAWGEGGGGGDYDNMNQEVGVAVAVGAEGELGLALLAGVQVLVAKIKADPKWAGRDVVCVAVTPWGKFVAGLNALVSRR